MLWRRFSSSKNPGLLIEIDERKDGAKYRGVFKKTCYSRLKTTTTTTKLKLGRNITFQHDSGPKHKSKAEL